MPPTLSVPPTTNKMAAPLQQSRKDVIPAIFIVAKGLMNLGEPVYGLEVCRALQDVTGEIDAISCVQKCAGLWRITPKHKAARAKILQTGIVIRGHYISVLGRSPHLLNGVETIRLNISNIPYEIPDSDIKEALDKLGVKFGHGIQYEFYKDENKNFTKVKTGRRFVNMAKPSQPLPEMVKIADKYRAYLNYNRNDATLASGNSSEKDKQRSSHTPRPDICESEEDFDRRRLPPTPRLGSIESSEVLDNMPWPPTPSDWWNPPPGYDHTSDNESEDDCNRDQLPTPEGWLPGQRNGFPPKPKETVHTVPDMIMDYWKSRDHIRLNVQSHLETLHVNDNSNMSSIGEHDLNQAMDNFSGNGFWATPDLVDHDNSVDLPNKTIDLCEEEQDFLSPSSLKTLCEDIGVGIPMNSDDDNNLGIDITANTNTVPINILPNLAIDAVPSSSTGELSNSNVPQTLTSMAHHVPLPTSANDSWESIATPQSLKMGSLTTLELFNDDTQPKAIDISEQAAVAASLNTNLSIEADMLVVESGKSVSLSSGTGVNSTLNKENQPSIKSRRSRSLTKKKLVDSRKRSSSKRKGSPKETPKGKKSTKNKTSPKVNKTKQEKMSKDITSGVGGTTAVKSKSSDFFDNWLNHQVRTSPT